MLTVYPDVQGLIFDCDGTLVDSMPVHMQAWREAMQAAGEPYRADFIDQFKGMPAIKIIERYNKAFGVQIEPESFSRDKNERAFKKLAQVQPIEPVASVVRQYQGKLPMAVASGGSRRNVEFTLKVTGLLQYFSVIITGDDRVAPKPSPDIFLEAARRLHVEPRRCQVFEDGDAGLMAARQAGMAATDVRPFV